MTTTRPDWPAVERAVNDRLSELGWTQADLVRESRISDATIRRLQNASRAEGGFRRDVLAAVSRALGWPPGTLTAISRGDPPPRTQDYLDRELLVRKITAVREAVDDLEEVVRRSRPRYDPSRDVN